MLWTLGFFLEIGSQLILTTGSWDSPPVYLVTHGDHVTSVSDKIVQKKKMLWTLGFFLEFFSQLILTTGFTQKSLVVGGWVALQL